MAPSRYGRPRLLTEDDKRYRAHVERFKLERRNNKAMRPPRQRELFGSEAEAALRDWLAGQFVLADTRILEYEERRNRSATLKYRELDALVLGDQSAWAFEIKASRTGSALRRAIAQLRETREILRLLYRTVFTTVLLVDTGIPTSAAEVAALMAGPHPPTRPPEMLVEALAALPEVQQIDSLAEHTSDPQYTDLLRFGVHDIIALVGAENLSLDWEADDLEPEEESEPPQAETFYSSPDNEGDADENPLAAALRKAGLKDG